MTGLKCAKHGCDNIVINHNNWCRSCFEEFREEEAIEDFKQNTEKRSLKYHD